MTLLANSWKVLAWARAGARRFKVAWEDIDLDGPAVLCGDVMVFHAGRTADPNFRDALAEILEKKLVRESAENTYEFTEKGLEAAALPRDRQS